MKISLKKYKKILILLCVIIVIIFIIGIKKFQDSHLTSEVYYNCKRDTYNIVCKYYMFTKNGKVYMAEQSIDNDYEQEEINNFEKLLLKHGIDNVVKKCNEYAYCISTLGISNIATGVYSIDNSKIKIEWDFKYNDDTYYKVKNGELWVLDSDLEITNNSYAPVDKYDKWNKCRKNNSCDEVFSIDDPLNDIDYDYIYREIENSLESRSCDIMQEYTFKDITGDGIKELLVRSSYNGKDWKLIQIYYFNTWANKILPLGDDKIPFSDTNISQVYEGGYIYISGKYIDDNYYKVSEDGFLLEYYEADSESDLPSQKSLYDDINDWKIYPKDEEYCE